PHLEPDADELDRERQEGDGRQIAKELQHWTDRLADEGGQAQNDPDRDPDDDRGEEPQADGDEARHDVDGYEIKYPQFTEGLEDVRQRREIERGRRRAPEPPQRDERDGQHEPEADVRQTAGHRGSFR